MEITINEMKELLLQNDLSLLAFLRFFLKILFKCIIEEDIFRVEKYVS
jgi:hypothetical protein